MSQNDDIRMASAKQIRITNYKLNHWNLGQEKKKKINADTNTIFQITRDYNKHIKKNSQHQANNLAQEDKKKKSYKN